ncbi:uncharacterized protein LOC122028760 isoform X2 [Zingiber officinale]|uniref:uncharacterized protein LOC122028760 isoform X2 n=1 Tax=Zingiber officinale TaxID=94328 RepID=UPI001C4D003B|nr:uncharacterized protein LOC122028760 isoform X2 [Zingiber officinale]
MVIHTLPLPSLLPPFNPRRRLEAKASATVGDPGSGRNKANLSARRQERVFIPNYCDGNGRAFPISDFFRHPTGMEALLNTRALQRFELLDANTFRCTLYKIQFLKFEVSPVIDLQVTPTDKDCTVEMLSCRVYTKPFSLLPLSAVEKPGNLVMQGLLDRLVPLLAEKLHSDYCAWVEQQMNSQL